MRVVVLGDMRDLYHHGCDAVMEQLVACLRCVGLTPQRLIPGLDWLHTASDVCLDADLVVINGEGALHHDRPAIESVLTLAERRRALGRPSALVNASWFANAPALGRRLAAFDLIALRDARSRSEVAALGVTSLEAPDLAIRHALQFRQRNSGATQGEGAAVVSDSTNPTVTQHLRRFATERGWRYLPVLYPPTGERSGEKALKIAAKCRLTRRLGPLGRWFMSPRYQAHLAGIGGLDNYCAALARSGGIVTGRFHTACLAVGLGVPLVALASNTPKIEALLEEAGLDVSRRIIKLDDLAALTDVPPLSNAERDAVGRFGQQATQRFDILIDRLRDLARVSPAASPIKARPA